MKYTVYSLIKISFQWTLLFPWILTTSSQVPFQTLFQAFRPVDGKVLNKNHVIKTLQSVMWHSTCFMECASHIDCYSMNFYPGRTICELNNATHLSHPVDFVEDPSGTFLLYIFRSIGWCSDSLCSGSGQSCFLNPDQTSFNCSVRIVNVPPELCNRALGLEDRRIPDSAFTASSSYPSSQPQACRLRNQDEWGARTNSIGQFLQVDLNGIFKVTAIATQGHYKQQFWVKQYKIAYRTSEGNQLQFYKENGAEKIFNGNVDKSSVVTNTFTQGFQTRYVRIVVQSWNGWAALRAELYGCSV